MHSNGCSMMNLGITPTLTHVGLLSVKFEQVTPLTSELQIATGQKESPEIIEISGLFGCGGRT